MAAFVALCVGAVAATLALGRAAGEADYRGSEPPRAIPLPSFTLRDYRGQPVTSASIRGDVVLVTFLDSQCTDACPLIVSHVARALALLGRENVSGITALAITTDPAEDTPGSVRAFLRKQRAEGKLGYLVGGERELRRVWRAFGILPSVQTGNDEMHSAPVRIYDRDGEWVATQHAGVDLTAANLAHDLHLAARNS